MKVRRIDKLLFASFLALSPCGAFAQDVITGTVVDSSGEPIMPQFLILMVSLLSN